MREVFLISLAIVATVMPGCLGEAWCDLQHSTCIGLQGISVEAQFMGHGNTTHAATAFQKMGLVTKDYPQYDEVFVEWNGTSLRLTPRYDLNETWYLRADLTTPGLSRYESMHDATIDAQGIWGHLAPSYIPVLDRFAALSGWTRTNLDIRPYGYIK